MDIYLFIFLNKKITLHLNMTTTFTASFCSLNVRGLSQLNTQTRTAFQMVVGKLFNRKRRKHIEIWMGWQNLFLSWYKSFERSNDALQSQISCSGRHFRSGRYLVLQTTIYDTAFQLCNIYSRNNNSDQKIFFRTSRRSQKTSGDKHYYYTL